MSFPRQFRGCQPALFIIDKREQFLGGLGIALLNGFQNARRIAHARRGIGGNVVSKLLFE